MTFSELKLSTDTFTPKSSTSEFDSEIIALGADTLKVGAISEKCREMNNPINHLLSLVISESIR